MNILVKTLLMGLSATLLLACSGEPAPANDKAEAVDAAQPDHVWKDQVETIDRAKAVEQTIKDADEAKRKAMENADGGE